MREWTEHQDMMKYPYAYTSTVLYKAKNVTTEKVKTFLTRVAFDRWINKLENAAEWIFSVVK